MIAVLLLLFAMQDSRVDTIAAQQTLKADSVHPYQPSDGERIFLAIKREFLDSPSGIYPLFGSVYGGGGFAMGAGYRQYYGDQTFWDAKGLWSIRNFKFAELSTNSLGHARGRIDLGANVGWRDAPRVAYYTPDRVDFHLKQTYAGAHVKTRPVSWIALGTEANFEEYKTERVAPAARVDPRYLHTTGSAGIDWRPSSGYARRGGLYELRYHRYSDQHDTYSFDRLDAEVVQHLPILRENWVISVHGLVNSTVTDSAQVPYFLLPSLGSGDTLRGYATWRFRDRHSLLMQGEFRWIPNRNGVDMAIFFDSGKVTARRSELDFKTLHNDIGAELRFHGPAATPMRLGIARGSEGWHFVFSGSAAF